jgi:hypothetical protein
LPAVLISYDKYRILLEVFTQHTKKGKRKKEKGRTMSNEQWTVNSEELLFTSYLFFLTKGGSASIITVKILR